jgi:hypothetical protein
VRVRVRVPHRSITYGLQEWPKHWKEERERDVGNKSCCHRDSNTPWLLRKVFQTCVWTMTAFKGGSIRHSVGMVVVVGVMMCLSSSVCV